jgi:hypothetical protein
MMPSCIQRYTGDLGGVGRPEVIPKVGFQGYKDVKTSRDAGCKRFCHSCESRPGPTLLGRNPEKLTKSVQTQYGWIDRDDKRNGFPFSRE